MGDAYPELRARRAARHRRAAGRKRSASSRRIAQRHGDPRGGDWPAGAKAAVLDGEVAFKLHDTYGFPLDLTADVCRERGVDGRRGRLRRRDGAAAASRRARPASSRWRRASNTRARRRPSTATRRSSTTAPRSSRSTSTARRSKSAHGRRRRASSCSTTRRSTPSRGGQVGDHGELRNASVALRASKTRMKIQADVFGHHGRVVEGTLKVGDMRQRQGRRRAPRPHHAQPLAPRT